MSQEKIKAPEKYAGHLEATQKYLGKLATDHRIDVLVLDRPPIYGLRLGHIARLASGLGVEVPRSEITSLERLESEPHPYSVTIGIEIENYRKNHLSSTEKTLLDEAEKEELRAQRQRLLEISSENGIPRDMSDKRYFEHALKPSRSVEVQLHEVEMLRRAGLLHDEHYYPLHITVGNISMDKPTGGEVRVLARGLEATGLLCSSKRLAMPQESFGGYWTSGDSGIYERELSEIKGGAEAVEFRTFFMHGKENFEEGLKIIHSLASCLSAYQDVYGAIELRARRRSVGRKRGLIPSPRVLEGADLESATELAAIWSWYSDEITSLFADYSIKRPSSRWKEPRRLPRQPGDFGGLIDLLDTDNPSGKQFRERALSVARQATEMARQILRT